MINDVQIVVRLPSDLVRKLDEIAKQMSTPGVKVSRSAVVRMMAIEGIDKSEVSRLKKGKTR